MTEVIGVRFKKVGKVYYFDPCGIQVKNEMPVIVETARGLEYGEVAMANTQVEDSKIVTTANRAGGILGGITTGMPVTLRVAVKPTPSISRPQQTVSLSAMEDTELVIRGRHDPCIAHRAVPVVEAVTATVILDLLLEGNHGTF